MKFEDKIKTISEMWEKGAYLSDIAEKVDMSPRDVRLIILVIKITEKNCSRR